MTRIMPFTEDALLTAVVKRAHDLGWLAYHVRNSRAGIVQGDNGFPDILAVRGRSLLAVELKSATGRLSPQQDAWLAALNAVGARTFMWRPVDWLSGAIERVLA